MSPAKVTVEIAGVSLRIPVYKDPETTKRIAAELGQRLQEIEGRASRIDSHAFALEAALELAIERERLQGEADETTAQTLHALDTLAATLDELIDAATGKAGPTIRPLEKP
jgi:cell division protein ZapA (FtsZ GTPase activity inhibitor)